MRIIRFSFDGFMPQQQTYHINIIHQELDEKWFLHFLSNHCPEHLKKACIEQHNAKAPFLRKHYEDFVSGIWAFRKGYKSNLSLSHLKKETIPCWEAEISDNTIVYNVNLERQLAITDPECKLFGFYIPANQLQTLKLVGKYS